MFIAGEEGNKIDSSSYLMNFSVGGENMNKTNQAKVMDSRPREQKVIFFKSQEEFAKALREGAATGEEKGFKEELGEE